MAKEEDRRPYEGGGAGGKLRTSRLGRRNSTPYDRPQTGRHAPAAVRAAAAAADNRRSGNTWFSRIVDPASRLITQGAVKWLSSVFKKNHPALPSTGDVVEEIEEDSLQEVPEEAAENAKVLGQDEEDTRASKQRSEPEFTEVEQLLKNKTFSREEFNRLTELLQSRIVDRSAGLKVCEEQSREELHGGAGPSNAVNAEAQRWREERQKAREEKNDSVWHNSLYANAPTPAVIRNIPDEVGSSPADIAKAFMGVRPYRASSLALQSKPFRDENTPSKPNGLSLVPRTEGWLAGNGQAEDKFKTPQTARMRSRIQNLSRTPYARNVRQQVPAERMGNGFPNSTPVSQWTPIQSPITGGRQALKRRSSVLDDDFTSGLSIRRTRHKPIFVSQLRNPDPSGSTSNQLVPFLSPRNDGERTVLESVKKSTEFEKQNAFPSREATAKDLYAGPCIPPQSSETARKILEHLDRMVPSPKEISAEAQLAIARDKSPSQLTVSMLNGPARRSTESIDATPLFDKYSPSSVQKNNQLSGQAASSAEQKYGGKGKAPLFDSVAMSVEAATSSGIGDVSSLIPDASPTRIDGKLLILDGPSNLPEKSKGFRMSALEESDDEGHASRNAGMSRHAQTGKVSSFTSDGNGANSIILDGDKQITSTTVLRKRSEENLFTSTTSVSLDSSTNNSSGFTFPVTPSNSNFAEPPPTPTVIPSPSNKGSTQPTTANVTPTYSFGSATPSKGPVFSFSTSGSTDVDTTKPKFDFKFESKPESSFSSTAVAAAASAPTDGSEPLAATFKGSSTSGLSESSPAFSSSSSMFSTSTTVATTSAGLSLFGGSVSNVNGMNSVPFSFAGKSSSAATTAKVESKLRSPDSVTQVEASSVVAEDQSTKSSTSGENCTIKSQNEPKSSGFASSPSLVGVTNGTLSTLSSTTAISASTSSLLPNTQSSFAGSLFGQVPSSATATTSGSFVFGSSANSSSLSSGNTSPSLFGSILSASASGASGSLFGLTAPSSLSSSSLPSFGLSNSSTSAQFASSSTPAPGSGTAPTFGAGSSLSVGSAGTSNFSGSSSTSFGLGSASQFGSNTSPSFGLSATAQFGSNTSPSFGLSTTPQFGSSTSPSFGLTSLQSSSSTAPSFVPGVTFGSNTSSFTTGSTPSFGSGSTPAFGSGSTPPFGSGSTPSFGSGSTFGSSSTPSFGGSSSSFVSASAPSFGGSSVSFGAASTPAFGGGTASYGSASTPLFGSNSTPSFGLGQPFGASSTTSSQSTMTSFGSGFGGTASLPSTGFSFGGSAAASSGSFTFGGAGSTPSGTTFSFGSTGTPPSTFTFASKDSSSMTQPIFGLTNSNSAFGAAPSPTPPADQMEDSMAEDPAQVSSPVPPVFGGQTASAAPSFVFGSQPTAPSAGQSVFQFGAQPGPAAANPFASSAPSTFNPPGGSGLEFSGGGFSLGAGGDRGNRKFIKAKRDKTRRK